MLITSCNTYSILNIRSIIHLQRDVKVSMDSVLCCLELILCSSLKLYQVLQWTHSQIYKSEKMKTELKPLPVEWRMHTQLKIGSCACKYLRKDTFNTHQHMYLMPQLEPMLLVLCRRWLDKGEDGLMVHSLPHGKQLGILLKWWEYKEIRNILSGGNQECIFTCFTSGLNKSSQLSQLDKLI